MEEMRGTGFAGSAPPFRGRERAAVDFAGLHERDDVMMFTTRSARD